jgi:hypothetical protein
VAKFVLSVSRGGGREAAEVISCVSTNKVKELLRQVSTPKYNVTLFHPLYFVRNNVPEGVTKPWAANPQQISRLPIAEIGSPTLIASDEDTMQRFQL